MVLKIKGIIKISVCIILAAAVFSGCTGNENLKDLSVVEGMGIDYENGEIGVTVQSLNLSKEGSGAEALSGNITKTVQGTEKNISAAVQRTSESLSKKLFFGQNQILVIGKDLAENNIKQLYRQLTGKNLYIDNNTTIGNMKQLLDNYNISLVDSLVLVNIAPSKAQAKTLIVQGGISLNDEKITDINYMLSKDNFKENFAIIKMVKKIFHRIILK